MRVGDLVRVTSSVSGDKHNRRIIHVGEIGMLIKSHYINDLSVTTRLWCVVLMNDGQVRVPDWCLERLPDDAR